MALAMQTTSRQEYSKAIAGLLDNFNVLRMPDNFQEYPPMLDIKVEGSVPLYASVSQSRNPTSPQHIASEILEFRDGGVVDIEKYKKQFLHAENLIGPVHPTSHVIHRNLYNIGISKILIHRKRQEKEFFQALSERMAVLSQGISSSLKFRLPLLENFVKNLKDTIEAKNHFRQGIDTLLETAGKPDWDNAGALALEPQTVALAQNFIENFPISILSLPIPDISATPDGEIDFDWMLEQDIMLTIGICPTGEITFAGTFGNAELSGKEPWVESDPLPFFVEACLEKLSQ